MADDMTPRRQFERRRMALRNERESWLQHWREIADYLIPRRGKFLTLQTGEANKGDKRNGKIVDETGTLALRTLASGMMAGITSPARPWFKLQAPDPEMMQFGPVRTWLEAVERRMQTVFVRSNLYNVLPVVYEELGAFGTAAMAVLEDDEDIVRCYPFTVGEYMLANGPRMVVDTFYREFPMTVAQLVGEFGIENVSQGVAQRYREGQLDQWVNVVHAIEPNDRRVMNMPGARGMPFRAVYYELGAAETERQQFLRVEGFEEFPIMAPRWHVLATDVYGRSPGMDALPSLRQISVMVKRKAQAIDKMVNPPMIAPSSLRGQATSILPGAVTYVDMAAGQAGQSAFRPAFEVNPRVNEMMLDIQNKQRDIERTFFADLFLMFAQTDRREITAREVDVRQEEKLLALGPMLERLHDELLDPLIDRTFSIMARNQLLPEAPPEMRGVELRVEYISMLAQAQRAVRTASIRDYFTFGIGLAGANPDVLDRMNFDKGVETYGLDIGVPSDLIRADDEVKKIRDEKARRAQQAQAMQMTDAAANTAKTMAETPIGDQNGLERVLAGMGVGA